MANRIYFIVICIFLLSACGETIQNTPHTKYSDLIERVDNAINPVFEDWVLFEHGTYIIFDHADTIVDLKMKAINLMKTYGPVNAGSPAGDFAVTHLTKTEGWVVSGHAYGMYTYVHPDELPDGAHHDIEIGLHGRSKRGKDGKSPKIIYVNRKNKN